MADRVYLGDTALVEANIFDANGVDPLSAQNVSWTFKKPDGTTITGGPTNISNTEATIAVNDTTTTGLYAGQVTFTLGDNTKKSTIISFEVIDPLQITSDTTTGADAAVDRAWMKLEDLFDSELGGPHMRDRTVNSFSRDKVGRFLPDALYSINFTYQPVTGFDVTNFPYTQNTPLLAQALLVESIYHLIRSYAEQPAPTGSQVTWFDRRDYMNRWQAILTAEETRLNTWLDLFKRQELGYASTSTLVGGYSNIYGQPPRYMRGRFPYIRGRW